MRAKKVVNNYFDGTKTSENLFYFLTYTQTNVLKEAIFINFSTNKEKGNCGLGMAIAYFSSHGYTVSIPLNDTQDYDLIVDKNNKIQKVQVKSTSCKTKYGVYQVALKSCGGTKGKMYKTLIETYVDILFVVTDVLDIYLFPINVIRNKSSLNLCKKYSQFKISF